MKHTHEAEQRRAIFDLLEFPPVPKGTLPALVDILLDQWRMDTERVFQSEIECKTPDALEATLRLCMSSWDETLEWYTMFFESLGKCRQHFIENASKLHSLAVLGPKRRQKHFVRGAKTTSELVRLVQRDGESRFFTEASPTKLHSLLQDCLAQRFETIWPPPPHALLDIDANRPIGISRTGETSIVRFNCDFSTREAHGFPIPAPEARLMYGEALRCERYEGDRYLD